MTGIATAQQLHAQLEFSEICRTLWKEMFPSLDFKLVGRIANIEIMAWILKRSSERIIRIISAECDIPVEALQYWVHENTR